MIKHIGNASIIGAVLMGLPTFAMQSGGDSSSPSSKEGKYDVEKALEAKKLTDVERPIPLPQDIIDMINKKGIELQYYIFSCPTAEAVSKAREEQPDAYIVRYRVETDNPNILFSVNNPKKGPFIFYGTTITYDSPQYGGASNISCFYENKGGEIIDMSPYRKTDGDNAELLKSPVCDITGDYTTVTNDPNMPGIPLHKSDAPKNIRIRCEK